MTYSSKEKNIAIALSLSIAFAFAGTTNVSADDSFPPSHTTGVFKESSEPSHTKVRGAYYRQGANNTVEVYSHFGNFDVAYSAPTAIAPYYRAAN